MGFRIKAQRAGWTVREAAWEVEDRLADAAGEAAGAAEPLQRLIDTRVAWPLQRALQTRVTWPVADAFRQRGAAARAALATGAVTAVAGAATIGVVAGSGGKQGGGTAIAPEPNRVELASAAGPELKGIAPDFKATEGAAEVKTPGSGAGGGVPPVPVAPPPGAPPAQVARSFADAFVSYEVGEVTERTAAVFSVVAKEPLAKALATEPPRLPASAEVPKARVLNVVMAEREGEKAEQVEASVSLVRLDAASELRLTLEHTPEGWQVTRVLG